MALPISSISLSNTFGQWVVTTQNIISELNSIGAGNFTKTANTFSITSSGTGLLVTNTAQFGAISVSRDSIFSSNVTAAKYTTTANGSVISGITFNPTKLTFGSGDAGFYVNKGSLSLDQELRWNDSLTRWEIKTGSSAYNKIITDADRASITANGIVKLNSDYTSSLITEAATISAVQNVYSYVIGTTANNITLAHNQANAAYSRANTANTNAANASFLTTGTVNSARLGSGTANANTFLSGSGVWTYLPTTYNANVPNSINVTPESKLREYISVKDFGAKGDGSANDTSAVQNAINYSLSTESNNKCVYFPAGNYLVNTLSVGEKITIRGDGRRNTLISCYSDNTTLFKYNRISSGTSVAFDFKDIYLNSNGKTGCIGIEITGADANTARCSNINIKDIDITGNFRRGIYLANSANIVIKDAFIALSNNAIYLYNPADCDITNVKIQYGNDFGIYVTGDYPHIPANEGLRITSCSTNGQRGGARIENHGWGSIVGCSFTTTSDNEINYNYPLQFTNTENFKVSSSEFASANTSNGISALICNGNTRTLSISDSHFVVNSYGIVLFDNTNDVSINGCSFHNQSIHHILADYDVKGLTVNGCIFKNPQSTGLADISLGLNVKKCSIIGNVFKSVYTPNGNNVVNLNSSEASNNKLLGNIMAGTYYGFSGTNPTANSTIGYLNTTNIGSQFYPNF